jgi:hypothetical protein
MGYTYKIGAKNSTGYPHCSAVVDGSSPAQNLVIALSGTYSDGKRCAVLPERHLARGFGICSGIGL